MDIRRLRKIEWLIPIAAIILCVIGLVALYSASYDTNLEEFKKQAIWIGISFVLMLIVMLIDYKILIKVSPIFYGISIIMLIAVLFTKPINGARSWFVIGDDLFSFQPAEISKIFIILFRRTYKCQVIMVINLCNAYHMLAVLSDMISSI